MNRHSMCFILLVAALAVPPTAARAQGKGAAPPLARPSNAQIDARLRQTVEVNDPEVHFKRIAQRTILDGRGEGTVTVVVGRHEPTENGLGHIVFFWHNKMFVGYASQIETPQVDRITSPGPGTFRLLFTAYKPSDAFCCPTLKPRLVTYAWSSYHYFISNGVPPRGIMGIAVRVKYRP